MAIRGKVTYLPQVCCTSALSVRLAKSHRRETPIEVTDTRIWRLMGMPSSLCTRTCSVSVAHNYTWHLVHLVAVLVLLFCNIRINIFIDCTRSNIPSWCPHHSCIAPSQVQAWQTWELYNHSLIGLPLHGLFIAKREATHKHRAGHIAVEQQPEQMSLGKTTWLDWQSTWPSATPLRSIF